MCSNDSQGGGQWAGGAGGPGAGRGGLAPGVTACYRPKVHRYMTQVSCMIPDCLGGLIKKKLYSRLVTCK